MKNNTLISASDRIAKSKSRENSKNREANTEAHKPEMDNGVGQLLGLSGPLGAMSSTPGMAYNHHLNLSSGQIHNRNYLTQTQNTGQSNKRHLNQSSRRNKRGATLTISQGQIHQNPKKPNKSFTGNQAISQKINDSHASDLVRTETEFNNSQISQGAIDEYNHQMQIKVSEQALFEIFNKLEQKNESRAADAGTGRSERKRGEANEQEDDRYLEIINSAFSKVITSMHPTVKATLSQIQNMYTNYINQSKMKYQQDEQHNAGQIESLTQIIHDLEEENQQTQLQQKEWAENQQQLIKEIS